ncbi:MAG TPA: hypothetical protein VFT98_20360 [Myxococcota bacterium]|nr:hypothetical protein [Myxococcota bacterium]
MLLAGAAAATPGPPAEKPRAAPGALLAPAETAAHVVAGTIGALRQLDAQGFSAELEVERALAGGSSPGAKLRIAWEELAASRALRFAQGERVLLALEPLPSGSLWMKRFPQRDAWAVAGRGEAFARDPAPATLDAIGPYLRLPRMARAGSPGVTALAQIARLAEQRQALEAIEQLALRPALAPQLVAAARDALGALLLDATRPDEVRAGALTLAARRRLTALEPEARKLSAAGGALAPLAVEALGAMGALSPEEARRHRASSDPRMRAAIVRGAPASVDAAKLEALARRDTAGEVRAAALEALARREGARAAGAAIDALFDADANVQAAALRVLPAFPAESAPVLRARVFGARAHDTEAMRPALAGLSLLGPDGAAVLREIERDHPNEDLRRLAQFLLGRTPEH